MRIIATEEHFVTRDYMDYLRSRKEYPKLVSFQNEKGQTFWRLWYSPDEFRPWYGVNKLDTLCDIGETRLKAMNKAGKPYNSWMRRLSVTELERKFIILMQRSSGTCLTPE